jgi:hypothetical protein
MSAILNVDTSALLKICVNFNFELILSVILQYDYQRDI